VFGGDLDLDIYEVQVGLVYTSFEHHDLGKKRTFLSMV
jgi:hypothetical protein